MIQIETTKQKLKLVLLFFAIFALSFISANVILGIDEGTINVKSIANSFPRSRSDLVRIVNDIKSISPKGYIVQSGSMEPTIKVGSIVMSSKRESYGIGDVITFAQSPGSKSLVTHRVVSRDYPDGLNKPPVYKTSGDANEEVDPDPVKHEQVVGKVSLTIPYLGYAANYAKQPYGFILLVIVPATIVIYEELKSLLSGVFGGLKILWLKAREKKNKDGNVIANDSEAIPENSQPRNYFFNNKELISKSWVFVPVFGCFLFFTGMVSAYLNDREESMENVLQAGIWEGALVTGIPTPTQSVTPIPTSIPQPSNVVINEVLYDVSASQQINESSTIGEFIEIYNPTLTSIDLTGWVLADNTSSEILAGSVPALGFMIVTAATEAEFRAEWSVPSDGSVVFFQAGGSAIGGGLANTGDRASLTNSSAVLIDATSWESDTTYLNPSLPNITSGHSYERNPDGLDTNTDDDFSDRNPPTPGT